MRIAVFLRSAVVWGCLGVALACATSPLGRRQLMLVSEGELEQMGVAAFEQMKSEGNVSGDARTNAYVTCVATALTRVLTREEGGGQPWEVRVFADDTANAFALPGRKIGVHTGLLEVARNPDQLATVVGHEIAHVIANHSGERVSSQMAAQGVAAIVAAAGDPSSPLNTVAQGALGLGVMAYGRRHESEADEIGLYLMARAGFDPRQAVPLWQNMSEAGGSRAPEFLSTHPSPETRIRDLQAQTPKALRIAERAWASGRKPDC